MSRLIDADALIEVLNDNGVPYNADANYFIEHAPTIDAVSVVHGKWIKRHGTINCSVCKRSNWSACFEDTVRSFNFCPNCGADMRGESDENRMENR